MLTITAPTPMDGAGNYSLLQGVDAIVMAAPLRRQALKQAHLHDLLAKSHREQPSHQFGAELRFAAIIAVLFARAWSWSGDEGVGTGARDILFAAFCCAETLPWLSR